LRERDELAVARLQDVHVASRDTYGAARVYAALRTQGERHGRKHIARLMRVAGPVGACHRKGGLTTTRRDEAARPTPDIPKVGNGSSGDFGLAALIDHLVFSQHPGAPDWFKPGRPRR